jgi:hypothetical protein
VVVSFGLFWPHIQSVRLRSQMYELEQEKKYSLRQKKKTKKAERVSIVEHTQMHVQKQRLKNGAQCHPSM